MMTLNHGLSGYVCAQAAMPALQRRAPLGQRALSAAFVLGAMAPDLDILTRLLAGRGAYFSGAWYGHRGLTHSLLGTLLLALLAAALLWRPAGARAAPRPWVAGAWLAGCAWAGGLLHLLGDVFTPGWPLPLFWPWPERFGALRHIGWISPYLLWLFLSAIALGTLAARGGARVEALRRWAPALAWAVYALAAYRWLSFMVRSRYTSWDEWMAYQQAMLPDALVRPLTQGVGMLWRWLTS
jgi:membrane-bound metal-dependent hydrolase YbcI (DUF457 family)